MSAKKPDVKRIKKAIKKVNKQPLETPPQPTITIAGCEINAIKFNPDAINAIETIADGFLANARGLTELSKIFSLIDARIETGIRIDGRDNVAITDCKMTSK